MTRNHFFHFLSGAGSLLNLWPKPTRYAFVPGILAKSDRAALVEDLATVSLDMWDALGDIVTPHGEGRTESAGQGWATSRPIADRLAPYVPAGR